MLHLRRKNPIVSPLCLFLVILLTIPPSFCLPKAQASEVAVGSYHLNSILEIDFSDIAEIKSLSRGVDEKTVFLIQDAHAVFEAQQNIAALIDRLSIHSGENLVLLEGSEGRLHHEFLSSYPDYKARQSVSDYFLKENHLSGAEHLTITKRPDLTLVGLEDKELYEKNRDAFLTVYSVRDDSARLLSEVKELLHGVAHHVFTDRLIRFNRLQLKALDSAEDLHTYLLLLREELTVAGIDMRSYPGIANLLAEIEGDVPANLADQKPEQTPTNEILDEVRQIEEILDEFIYQNNSQRVLNELYHQYVFYERMFSLRLDEEDRAYFESKGSDLGSAYFIKQIGYLIEEHDIKLSLPINLAKLDLYIRHASEFYNLATQRDDVLAKNALKYMDEYGAQVSFLVAGGFHSKGMQDILRKEGINFVVFTPKTEQTVDIEKREGLYYDSIERNIDFLSSSLGSAVSLQGSRFVSTYNQLAMTSLLLDSPKGRWLVEQSGLSVNDILSIIRNDPQLGFNIVFTLLLQLESLTSRGNLPSDLRRTLKSRLPGDLVPVADRLYRLFIDQNFAVVPGEDLNVRHYVGNAVQQSRSFLATVTRGSKSTVGTANWARVSYQIGANRYDLGIVDRARLPYKRAPSADFAEAYGGPRSEVRSAELTADQKLIKLFGEGDIVLEQRTEGGVLISDFKSAFDGKHFAANPNWPRVNFSGLRKVSGDVVERAPIGDRFDDMNLPQWYLDGLRERGRMNAVEVDVHNTVYRIPDPIQDVLDEAMSVLLDSIPAQHRADFIEHFHPQARNERHISIKGFHVQRAEPISDEVLFDDPKFGLSDEQKAQMLSGYRKIVPQFAPFNLRLAGVYMGGTDIFAVFEDTTVSGENPQGTTNKLRGEMGGVFDRVVGSQDNPTAKHKKDHVVILGRYIPHPDRFWMPAEMFEGLRGSHRTAAYDAVFNQTHEFEVPGIHYIHETRWLMADVQKDEFMAFEAKSEVRTGKLTDDQKLVQMFGDGFSGLDLFTAPGGAQVRTFGSFNNGAVLEKNPGWPHERPTIFERDAPGGDHIRVPVGTLFDDMQIPDWYLEGLRQVGRYQPVKTDVHTGVIQIPDAMQDVLDQALTVFLEGVPDDERENLIERFHLQARSERHITVRTFQRQRAETMADDPVFNDVKHALPPETLEAILAEYRKVVGNHDSYDLKLLGVYMGVTDLFAVFEDTTRPDAESDGTTNKLRNQLTDAIVSKVPDGHPQRKATKMNHVVILGRYFADPDAFWMPEGTYQAFRNAPNQPAYESLFQTEHRFEVPGLFYTHQSRWLMAELAKGELIPFKNKRSEVRHTIMDVGLYKEHLQPHFRERGARPLPEIMQDLHESGMLRQIFPIMEELNGVDVVARLNNNVYEQMILSARFLWEYEVGEDEAEFAEHFAAVAATPEEREAAYLLAFTFDIGKVDGATSEHPEISARMMDPVYDQLGISRTVKDRALWVMAHHGALGEIVPLWERLPPALFETLRTLPDEEVQKDLKLLALINSADAHAWYRGKLPGTRKTASNFLKIIKPGYLNSLDWADERLKAFSLYEEAGDIHFNEAKHARAMQELERFLGTGQAKTERPWINYMENMRKTIREMRYAWRFFMALEGPALARTLFLMSQLAEASGREVHSFWFNTHGRRVQEVMSGYSEVLNGFSDEFLLGLSDMSIQDAQRVLANEGLNIELRLEENLIIIDNEAFLPRSEVRMPPAFTIVPPKSDQWIDRRQQHYEAARDDRQHGGYFGMDKAGAYFGLSKQRYMERMAMEDSTFYYDAASIWTAPAEVDETMQFLYTMQEREVIPSYVFIFNTKESMREVRKRYAKQARSLEGRRLVPFGIVAENIPGNMRGALYARRILKDKLTQLGYDWDELKIKAHFLVWSSGGRVWPFGRYNKMLADTPIADLSYLEANLRLGLQYFHPNMKLAKQPGRNIVFYPDSYKYVDEDYELGDSPKVGSNDFEFFGSMVNANNPELKELGVANVDPSTGELITFFEKPVDNTDLKIRLGVQNSRPHVFRSFGDLIATDAVMDSLDTEFDALFRRLRELGVPKKVLDRTPLDFAYHIGDGSTLRERPELDRVRHRKDKRGTGLNYDAWAKMQSPAIDDGRITMGILKVIESIFGNKGDFTVGVAAGGTEGRFLHSNSIGANVDMIRQLLDDPFVKQVAGVHPDHVGQILGPGVYVGEPVVLALDSVLNGRTTILNGSVGSLGIVRNSWLRNAHVGSGALVNDVIEDSSDPLRVDDGLYVNDVYVHRASLAKGKQAPPDAEFEKFRFVRYVDAEVNAKMDFGAVVIASGALQKPDGDIDPRAIEALENLLTSRRSPMVGIVSHYDLHTVMSRIVSQIEPALRHKVILFTQDASTARGFDGDGNPLPDPYYKFSIRIKERMLADFGGWANGALKGEATLRRNYDGFISYSFESEDDLIKAARWFKQNKVRYPSSPYEITLADGQLRLAPVDRSYAIHFLRRFLKLDHIPGRSIFVIGSTVESIRGNRGNVLIPGADVSLLEQAQRDRAGALDIADRVHSLVVKEDVRDLSLAVHRSPGAERSVGTIRAIEEVTRIVRHAKAVKWRDWKIHENSVSMQQLKVHLQQDPRGTRTFEDEKGKLRRSEIRSGLNLRSSQRSKFGQAARQWFRAYRSESAVTSSRPSFFISEWDGESLDPRTIESMANRMSPRSTLILRVPAGTQTHLQEVIDSKVALYGPRRILLSEDSTQSVVQTLMEAHAVEAGDIYDLEVDAESLRDDMLRSLIWYSSRELLQPGRIVVFNQSDFDMAGSQNVYLSGADIESMLTATFVTQTTIRQAA